jgi:hypothetical protein
MNQMEERRFSKIPSRNLLVHTNDRRAFLQNEEAKT